MSDVIISVEHLSKKYRLGQIGATTLRESAERVWHKLRGRDPDEEMGQVGKAAAFAGGPRRATEGGNLKPEKGKAGERGKGAEVRSQEPEGYGAPDSERAATQQPDNLTTQQPVLQGSEARSQKSAIEQSSATKNQELGTKNGEPVLNSTTEQPSNLTTDPTRDSELWALRDVSFEVKRGEVLGIIGRNGAGKSTLLKILTRITEPTSGRAVMRGRVASLLEVGTGFHPELTGRENIFLNGAILGMRKAEIAAKFDEIVAFAEVEKFIDTPVKRYSSGMYVRLAFAVAAHLEPEILLVDEVLAVGDATFQKKCLGKMGDVAQGGRTVLFVSHNMTAVRTLCHRSIFIEAGRAVQVGNTPEVVANYLGASRPRACEMILDRKKQHPYNPRCYLSRIAVTDKIGEVKERFRWNEQVKIVVEYENLEEGNRLGMTVVLYNQEGVCVFSSINNHEPKWYGRPMPAARYRTVCAIPDGFLAEGRYKVSVLVFEKAYQLIHREDESVEFDVYDTGDIRGDYYSGWAGVVMPLLDWRTDEIGFDFSAQR